MVLTLSLMFASAPWSMSSFATASRPLTAAEISAVLPSYERQHNLDHTPSPILVGTADKHLDIYTHNVHHPNETPLNMYVCMYYVHMNCKMRNFHIAKYACKMYAFIS